MICLNGNALMILPSCTEATFQLLKGLCIRQPIHLVWRDLSYKSINRFIYLVFAWKLVIDPKFQILMAFDLKSSIFLFVIKFMKNTHFIWFIYKLHCCLSCVYFHLFEWFFTYKIRLNRIHLENTVANWQSP